MTPEQLEAIEGIGPKTVEKISLAVNNYFSSLEAGEAAPAGTEVEAAVAEGVPESAAPDQTQGDEAVASDGGAEVVAEVEGVEAAPAEENAVEGSSDGTSASDEPPAEEEAPAEPKE
jgi:N utilization substance protein A